ncbi:P-loop containing nucleoside triphosphate hydrolase protein [Mycena crocata]|nr:P-loop containing nucleoside triphosphate hydrolase protein [Mycena crocata]
MLPSQPKIFYGRETELSHILDLFVDNTPRLAILGPGGIGKTSLAKAVLHHPQITAKFDQRHFVASDSVSSSDELASLIGAHLSLKPAKDITKSIIQFFTGNSPCLLILDNLETSWDPKETREDLEAFLSLLTDVGCLALLVSK